MKNTLYFLLIIFSLNAYSQHEHHEHKTDTIKSKSPRKTAMAKVGDNHVHIDYASPSVRGRVIWNGLVSYGQVWVTGAHKATWIEFSHDVTIKGQPLPKGKYGFFTIPDQKEWTVILSKDWDMHLAGDYTPANDVLRFKVKPLKSKNLTESLTYQVKSLGNGKGLIHISWEYLSLTIEFENL